MAIFMGGIAKQQILFAGKIEQRQSLYDISSSGIVFMIDALQRSEEIDDTPESDSLNDYWANSSYLFGPTVLDDGVYTFRYEYTDNVSGETKICYGAVDEERKININHAQKDVLENLLTHIANIDNEQASVISDAIIDWRDEDDVLSSEEKHLTEDAAYAKQGLSHRPSNSDFLTLEELLFVYGMDIGIFSKLKDYITVYGSGRVNINTAPIEVLICLGLDEELADYIISYRSGLDMEEGTSDDNVFDTTNNIIEGLEERYELSDKQELEMANLLSKGFFDTRSTTFLAECISRLTGTRSENRILCVFDKDGSIQYWSSSMQRMSGVV
jgi:hypothetical protein